MIEIALAFHDANGGYSLHAAATLVSIFRNTREKIHANIVHDKTLSEKAKKSLTIVAAHFQQKISFHQAGERKFPSAIKLPPQLGPGSLYRLFLPELLPCDEVIYLDCDICFMMDIVDLAATASDKAPDSVTPLISWTLNGNCIERNKAPYYNSGVMLMNLKNIRHTFPDFALATIRAMPLFEGPLNFPDQDGLNVLMRKLPTRVLPDKYNFQLHVGNRWLMTAQELAGKVVHYCGHKPWCEPVYPSAIPHLENYRLVEEIISGSRTKTQA